MKKLITPLLALAKVLRLTACGEQPAGATGDDGDTASVESDGRALYEAAIQLACDGDFPGSIEGLKKAIKQGMSEDVEKDAEAQAQKIHDRYMKKIDELFAAKEKEILTV